MQIELTNQSFFLKLSLIFVDMTISTMRTFLATLQSPSGARDAECLLLLQSFCMLYSRVAEGLMRHLRPIPQMVDWSNSFMEHLLSKLEHNADMLRFVFSLVPRKPFLSVPVSPQSAQSASVSASVPSPSPAVVAVVPSPVPSPTSAWLPGPTVPSESNPVIEGIDRLVSLLENLSEHNRKSLLPLDQSSMLMIDGIVADAAVQPALEALFLVYPALCVHLWHYVCRSLRTLDEKQLRTIGLSSCRSSLHFTLTVHSSLLFVDCLHATAVLSSIPL